MHNFFEVTCPFQNLSRRSEGIEKKKINLYAYLRKEKVLFRDCIRVRRIGFKPPRVRCQIDLRLFFQSYYVPATRVQHSSTWNSILLYSGHSFYQTFRCSKLKKPLNNYVDAVTPKIDQSIENVSLCAKSRGHCPRFCGYDTCCCTCLVRYC